MQTPSTTAGLTAAAASILYAALTAANPHEAVLTALAGEDFPSHVLAIGKAAPAMAAAALQALQGRSTQGIVITKYGHLADSGVQDILASAGLQLLEASHPIPDEAGVRAAQTALEFVQSLPADARLLVLLSGGGSALSPLPVEGVTLADLQSLTDSLLSCGACISEINALRKHLSRFAGGRLAAACACPSLTLALSDVPNDSLDVIASGPTVPDPSTFKDCLAILEKHGLLGLIPAAIEAHLREGLAAASADAGGAGAADGGGAVTRPAAVATETPKHIDSSRHRVKVVGSNKVALAAAAKKAACFGGPICEENTTLAATGLVLPLPAPAPAAAAAAAAAAGGSPSVSVCTVPFFLDGPVELATSFFLQCLQAFALLQPGQQCSVSLPAGLASAAAPGSSVQICKPELPDCPFFLLAGSELTVKLQSSCSSSSRGEGDKGSLSSTSSSAAGTAVGLEGKGGRNQHLALQFCLEAETVLAAAATAAVASAAAGGAPSSSPSAPVSFCFACLGTDGTDGPTDAAGAYCTDASLSAAVSALAAKAVECGPVPAPSDYSAAHASYSFWKLFKAGAGAATAGASAAGAATAHLKLKRLVFEQAAVAQVEGEGGSAPPASSSSCRRSLGGHIMTGATGTNVMDLLLLAMAWQE